MRLFGSTGSPFVRKARIVVREKGLSAQVEDVMILAPYSANLELTAANPIGQVPALVLEDGAAITNSPVICAYLDHAGSGPRLIPSDSDFNAYITVRRLEALGDGVMEMAVKIVMENRRPEGERSANVIEGWRKGLFRALDAAEAAAPEPDVFNLGAIALVVALTYVQFRMPDLGAGAGRPKLTALQAALEARPSFVETYPHL